MTSNTSGPGTSNTSGPGTSNTTGPTTSSGHGSKVDHRSFWALTCSQFLGAFNDNLFKQFILVLALYLGAEGRITLSWWPEDPQAIAGAVFALPFVMFALLGGFLADKISKRRVIVAMNLLEVIIMGLGMATLYYGTIDLNTSIVLALVVLFLMGTQSAFFGPSKYGTIPEIVPESKLSWANGIVQMTTMVAIILGTSLPLFSQLTKYELPFYYSGYLFIGIGTIGWFVSWLIRPQPAADPDRAFSPRLLAVPVQAFVEFRRLAKDRELLLAVLAGSWFWLIGAVALFVTNSYGQNELGFADAGTRLHIFTAGGIAVGSLVVGWISGPRVELGIVPVGIVGMSLGFACVSFLEPNYWVIGAALAVTGFFGGIYVVPLHALIQQRPSKEEKGRVLGTTELSNFIFIFGAAGVYFLLANVMELTARNMMLALGILTLVGAGLICSLSPTYGIRLILWVMTHTIYRMRVVNPENVPNHGGALLVSNHVSYADPFLVGSSVPRYVRFLMHRQFMNVRGVSFFARLMKAIPIAGSDSPRELIESLKLAAGHVKEGHVACIFAEGAISRTGNLLTFSKGLEHIAKRAGVPIVPVYLDRVWGSIFSYRGGRFFFKLPTRIPYPVTVVFGKPLPPDTPAHLVRQAVQELGAEAFDLRKKRGDTLATRMIRMAARHPFRTALVDHTGQRLTFFRSLAAVFLLRKKLRAQLKNDEKYIGVLMPTTNGGALANLALAVLGKVAVNLNYTAGKESYSSAVEQCGIRTIITADAFLEKIGVTRGDEHLDLSALMKGATKLDKLKAAFMALLPAAILTRLPGVPHEPDEVVTIIFSSGSTGVPKGVCLTHHNILSNARGLDQVLDTNKHDCIVGVLPFFHSFGYMATLWFPFLSGFKAAYHPNPVDAANIAERIRDEKGTIFVSTPTFYLSYLRRWKKEDVESLRIAVSGAEKLKVSLGQSWFKRFDRHILEGYGCTELSPAVSINLPDAIDLDREVHQVGHKSGTIGHPLPGIATKIVNPDTFETLGPEEEGLLLVKGANVMRGYLGRDDLTTDAIRDGWYVTGDIAKFDSDGFLTITDRLSRFSKIGGEMVPHVRVEEAVQGALDKIHECVPDEEIGPQCPEAAVTSLPDERKGERLSVLHTPVQCGVDEILSIVKESGIPNLWIPRRDAFIEVPEIPKLPTGKLDLRRVKELAQQSLENSEA